MCLNRSNGLLACFLSFTLYFCSSPSFAEGGDKGSQKDGEGEQSSQLGSWNDAPPRYTELYPSPPPPYSEMTEGENESVIAVGAHTYKVTYRGDVPYMTQSNSRKKQAYEIVCDPKLQELPVGHYVVAKAKHSLFFDDDRVQEFSGEIWLFPNGVDTPELKGRALILPHKYTWHTKGGCAGGSAGGSSGAPVSRRVGVLTLSGKEVSTHVIYLSQINKTTGYPNVHRISANHDALHFIDLGESRQQGEFIDEFGKITYQVTLAQTYASMESLKQGTLINIKIPNGRLHQFHENEDWNSSGRRPPASSTFEVGGQVLQLRFPVGAKNVTPYLTIVDSYNSMRLVADAYRDKESQPNELVSEARRREIEGQVIQEGSRAFYDFLRDHTISIYWEPPQGERRRLGQYGGLKVTMSRHTSKSVVDTLSLSKTSGLSYEEFFHRLGEDDAVFSIEVQPNWMAKLGKKMRPNEPVQDDFPQIVRSFQRLSLNLGSAKQ